MDDILILGNFRRTPPFIRAYYLGTGQSVDESRDIGDLLVIFCLRLKQAEDGNAGLGSDIDFTIDH